MLTVIPKVIPKVFRKAVLGQAEALMHGGSTLPGAIHTSGIYPSSRLSESYVGQCWTPDQGGVYRVAGSGYGQVRGAKLATTVAEGAILGPELVTNEADRTFSSDTGWWTKEQACTISNGFASVTTVAIAATGLRKNGLLAIGARYQITGTLPTLSGGNAWIYVGLTAINALATSGVFKIESVCAGDTAFRLYCQQVGVSWTLDNISIREVIPVWIAPDTYPTRSVRTRLGTARVPTGTSVGMVSSPAFTNKVTCRKTNPTDLTNITKTGDAASVLSVVDDVAALAAAGLSQICSTGKVYKLDNSAGTGYAYTIFGGSVGNTNKHSSALFIRVNSGGTAWITAVDGTTQVVTNSTTYTKVKSQDVTPYGTLAQHQIRVYQGSIAYFILPELVESSYLPADPIVPLTAAADTLAAFTRAAVYAERDTAGVFPTVTEVAREYVQNNCFATLGAGGADVFAGWTEFWLGSSTVTQELVDLPAGFTSACKLTTDSSNSYVHVEQTQAINRPVVTGDIIRIIMWIKSNSTSGVKFQVSITNGVTPLQLSSDGLSWVASGEYAPNDLPVTWSKYIINLPAIPSGYTSITALRIIRNNGASASHLITGISIGDTGIQNPYSSAASLMSDGSVVPVVAGASWAQNFAVFGTCVPDAGGQGGTRIVTSYVNGSNNLLIVPEGSTSVSIYHRISGTLYGSTITYTYAANAPFDYLAIQTIHGMAIRIRPHATMTWSAWATNVTTNGKKPAPIGSKYQIGAFNGAAGIAGTHPKVSIFELGNQATLAAYQDRAMLLAGRITG